MMQLDLRNRSVASFKHKVSLSRSSIQYQSLSTWICLQTRHVQEGPIQGTRPDLFGDSDSEEEAEIPAAEEVIIASIRGEKPAYQPLKLVALQISLVASLPFAIAI